MSLFVSVYVTTEELEEWETDIEVEVTEYQPYAERTHHEEGSEAHVLYDIIDSGGLPLDVVELNRGAIDAYVLDTFEELLKQQKEDREVDRYLERNQ